MAKKILVVDDEEIITKTISNLLKREGYVTEVAETGLQAIEKVKKANFDLIVVDIRMPNMNGLEFIHYIKKYLKSNKKPDIPVIFITGYADSDGHIKAEKFGKVIFKPFDMKEFLAEVARSLSKK
ncbi:MAG: response regulator [Candidatus Omnitrophica bacterium]|nr:response regulator [Candidatus Omnitrophota bacterium]